MQIMSAQYSFFKLVENEHAAVITLAAISCFGTEHEKKVLKPQANQLLRAHLSDRNCICLTTQVNKIIANYLARHGDMSDKLMLFISKGLPLAVAA